MDISEREKFSAGEKPRLPFEDAAREVERLVHPDEIHLANLKIAVTGSPCSGKSTAINDLSETLAGKVSKSEEQARHLFRDMPHVPDRLEPPPQYRLAHWILLEERAAAEGGLPVIADRTVLDGAMYVLWGGNESLAEELVERIRPWLATYDHIVLCDYQGIPFEGDEVRTETPEDRERLHQVFADGFDRFGIEYDLLSGDKQARHDHLASLVHP